MFGSMKVKIAAGLATGALSLGAAGAYAANNTITVTDPKPITVTGAAGTSPLTLISVSGKTTTVTLPATFKNAGECVSFFAKNKDLALAPAGTSTGPLKLSKNYHGKLMSSMNAWCKTQLTKSTTADSTEAQTTETPDATQADSTDATDSTSSTHGKSGQAHGTGHGRGHSND